MENFTIYGFDELLDTEILKDNKFLKKVIKFGEDYGFNGNLWQAYIAFNIIMDENTFSLSAEKLNSSDTLRKLAFIDMEKIRAIFNDKYLKDNCPLYEYISNFSTNTVADNFLGNRINKLVKNLSVCKNAEEYLDIVRKDYNKYGAGLLSIKEAFRLNTYNKIAEIEPVPNLDFRDIGHIIGYESQKKALLDNTKAFIEGKSYNNVLLYGDAGTGKSSSVKALIPEFADKKLKIIEIYKHQYIEIPHIMSEIDKRGFKFILYLDDLSFENFETEYKYFKAVLEGGLGSRPSNVAIYATSNRMHLIKENFSDDNDMSNDELHRSDTVEEKLSLSMRFGLRLYFGAPDQKEYLNIVHKLAKRENIKIDQEELSRIALTWAMSTNSKKTGRSAEQFIIELKNKY